MSKVSLQRPVMMFLVFALFAWLSVVIQWEAGLGADALTAVTIILYVVIFATLLIFLRQDGERVDSLGFRVAGSGKVLLFSAFLGIFFQILWMIIASAATGAVFDFSATPAGTFLVSVLVNAVLVAFVEECAFRGYIQRKFTGAYGPLQAIVVTAILFMLPHIQVYSYMKLTDPAIQLAQGITAAQAADVILIQAAQTITVITGLGIFTGYMYHESGQSIFPPVLLHMMFNIGGLLVLSYSNIPAAVLALGAASVIVLMIVWVLIDVALIWAAAKILYPKKD
ncbi:MAG: type II CAAX endopeptidase family protein [Candidatus Hadarchaeota archaeon]